MAESGYNERPDEVSSEAIRWFVLMQSDEITVAEQQRFAAWLALHPTHLETYREVQRFWHGLDALAAPEIDAVDELRTEAIRSVEAGSKRHPRKSASWRRGASVVALVLLIGISTLWLTDIHQFFADYHTAKGAQQTLTLDDGSTVQMNTDTVISAHISAQVRRITLHKGEAFFVVTHDSTRPFDVVVGASTIRALGTEFNVRHASDHVMVTVLTHAVQVLQANGTVAARVAQSERFTYRPDDFLGTVEQVDLSRVLAWRRHRMVFENQRLSEVISELNRYRPGRIVLVGAAIQRFSVTGVFDTHDTDKVLHIIEETLPVRVRRLTDFLLLLYATSDH